MKWRIAGLWTGQYSYNASEEHGGALPRTTFVFDVQSGWFGFISGVIQDDPMTGASGEATVRGRVRGNIVHFDKQYPSYYHIVDGRCVHLRDVIATSGYVLDSDVLPRPIEYFGEYDEETGVVGGEWHMEAHQVTFTSRGTAMAFTVPDSTGTWFMSRKLDGTPL